MAFKRNKGVTTALGIGFKDPKIALELFCEKLEAWGFFVRVNYVDDNAYWVIHIKSGYEQREGKYRLHYLKKSLKFSIHKHFSPGCTNEYSRVYFGHKSPALIFEKFKEIKESHLESLRKQRDRILEQIQKAEEALYS